LSTPVGKSARCAPGFEGGAVIVDWAFLETGFVIAECECGMWCSALEPARIGGSERRSPSHARETDQQVMLDEDVYKEVNTRL
jgi:hypothetical protein